jgi:hypothetical protein
MRHIPVVCSFRGWNRHPRDALDIVLRHCLAQPSGDGRDGQFFVVTASGIRGQDGRLGFEVEDQLIGASALVTATGEVFPEKQALVGFRQIRMIAATGLIDPG